MNSFAAVPMMYPFGYLFKVPSTAFVILSSASIFIGTITVVMTVVFENFAEEPVNFFLLWSNHKVII